MPSPKEGTRITIFGAGLVATEMATDLAHRHAVTVVDNDPKRLQKLQESLDVKTVTADLSQSETVAHVLTESRAEALAMALPGGIAFKILETIVHSRAVATVVDASFFQENPFGKLNEQATQNGQVVVVQMGIAPGIMNMPAAYHSDRLAIETAKLYCGGLPRRANNPLHHTYQFNDADNLKLWRSPEHIERGQIVKVPRFTGWEKKLYLDDLPPDIPYLEAANTAGVMTSLAILGDRIPNIIEKSLRHPGHISAIEMLFRLGFFDETPIGTDSVSPHDLAHKLVKKMRIIITEVESIYLFPFLAQLGFADTRPVHIPPGTTYEKFTLDLIRDVWRPVPQEDTLTAARIELSGKLKSNGKKKKIVYSLVHLADGQSGKNSLSPNTALPAAATLQAILDGRFTRPGINGPEHVAMSGDCFEYVLDYLSQQGLIWKKEEL